jgi:hypothetical protein
MHDVGGWRRIRGVRLEHGHEGSYDIIHDYGRRVYVRVSCMILST